MMMLTAVDVAGRYLFNKPLTGGFELTEMMLAALIYCGLPLVSHAPRAHRRRHLRPDYVDARQARASTSFADSSAPPTLAGLGCLIFRRAVRVAEYGDTTSVLKLPLAPRRLPDGHDDRGRRAIHLWLIFVPHRDDDGQTHHLTGRA